MNIDDLRRAARRRAHKMVFDYIDGAAGDEITLANNNAAFSDYSFLFKTLVGVDDIDLSTSLLGQKLDAPFLTSPAAGNRLFHTEGERAVTRAAGDCGIIYCLSTLSSVSIEEIAALTTRPKWFQLYVWKDRALVKEMLARARAAGFSALVLTVDFPITGNRERDARNGFTIPPKLSIASVVEALKSPAWTWDYMSKEPIRYANLSSETPAVSLAQFVEDQLHAGFSWADAEWLLGEWNGPAVIKGIVRTDDAKRAIKTGFNAVMVSNHGGRQLDRSAAPIDALERIVNTVADAGDVILDGGIRRGVDVLTALALGAKAVSFARPYLYGLAAGGEDGVRRALEIITSEIKRDMALLGARSIAEIDRSMVVKAGV